MTADAQTMRDLELFESTDGTPGIFALFDYTKTDKGREKLRALLLEDLLTLDQVKSRQATFGFFHELAEDAPPVHKNQFLFITQYLRSKLPMIRNKSPFHMALTWLRLSMRHKGTGLFSNMEFISEGVTLITVFTLALERFLEAIRPAQLPDEVRELAGRIEEALSPVTAHVSRLTASGGHPFRLLAADWWLRTRGGFYIDSLTDSFALLDAFFSVGTAMKRHNMCFPEILESGKPFFSVRGLYHPFLSHPVTQDFQTPGSFLFLTGPNMAGKTTFLKALGISVLLGRAGFPVFAGECRMELFQGLFTSINTEDNIRKGYSYFFSEVHRVKEAGRLLQQTHCILFIFDELFKGTNVKDAYDASRLVIRKFTLWGQNLFILSSHLIELAEEARDNPSIAFYCFDSSVVDGRPLFTYKINEGISRERLGLLILQNEGIPDLLEPPSSSKE